LFVFQGKGNPTQKGERAKKEERKKDVGCVSNLNYVDKSHIYVQYYYNAFKLLPSNAKTPDVAI